MSWRVVDEQLLTKVLEQDDGSHHLDASCGGACTASADHHEQRGEPEGTAPKGVVVVFALEATGGDDGEDVEQGGAKGLG